MCVKTHEYDGYPYIHNDPSLTPSSETYQPIHYDTYGTPTYDLKNVYNANTGNYNPPQIKWQYNHLYINWTPCMFCGQYHNIPYHCPNIKSIEYFENGLIKKIEFKDKND